LKLIDYFELVINKLLDRKNQTFATIILCGLFLSLLLIPLLIVTSLENNLIGILKLVETNNVYAVSQNSSAFFDSKLDFVNITLENAQTVLPVLVIKGYYLEHEITIKGITNEYIKTKNVQNIDENKFTSQNTTSIGSLFAKLFNITIGETVKIKINNSRYEFKVVSIHYSNSEDDYALLINLKSLWLKGIYKNKVSYYEIFLKEKRSNELEKKLEENLKQKIKIVYNDPSKTIEKISEEPIKIILTWINLIYLISFLAGFSFMLANSKNFKYDIGIFVALGLNIRERIILFLIISIILSFLSTIVGIVLSTVIASSMLTIISGFTNFRIELILDIAKILNLSTTYFIFLFLGYFIGMIIISRGSIKDILK
jgi:ABC-type lipoprotein release transport system permease subunit